MDDVQVLKVEKRDGRIVDFDNENIVNAVTAAYKDLDRELGAEEAQTISEVANTVRDRVIGRYAVDGRPVRIDDIQNTVITVLQQQFHLYDVARAYNDYKFARDEKRAKESDVNYAVERLLKRDKSLVNENANKDSNVFSVQRDLLSGSVEKAIARKQLPADVVRAHERGQIHFHDMDYSPFTAMTNCCLPNFKDMLAHGFKLGNAEMESPKSIETASTQITQIIQSVSSSQYGGQTVDRADELLAPYAMINYRKNMEKAELILPENMDIDAAKSIVAAFKEKEPESLHMPDKTIEDKPLNGLDPDTIEGQRDLLTQIFTRKNIYDAMQTFFYQVETQYSSNGQTPFISMGFGLGTSWAEKEIQRAILYVSINGLGKDHRTAIFPKLLFTIKHGVNSEPEDPNYDIKRLALECTTKRMYPDVLFYENVIKISGSFKAPMGCRSFLQGWINPETGEDEESGRMNLGVVTVNLPYIALESKGDKKKFWKIFEQRMEVVHHGLQARIKRCCEAQVVNAPTLYQYGAFGRLNPGDNVSKLFKNKRSTISLGYTGVYEAVAVFYGKDWVNDFGWDEEAHDFALSILSRMNDLCHQWEEEEDIHYSVYATPAESTTDRFSRALKDKFGIVEGVTDHDFVTNSFHRPVWLSGMPDHDPTESEQEVINRPSFHVSMDSGAMSKIDFEEPFLKYTPGGHIVYVEMPTMWQNLDAAEAIWDYEHDHGIDYSGLNSPIDHCEKCDFRGDCLPTEEGFKCPICGNMDPSTLQVVKRVCGYLGEPAARKPVKGRLEEIAHRKLHSQGEIGRVRNQNGDEEAIYGDYALPRTSKLIK